MKKLLMLAVVAGFTACTFTSCGPKKEEKSETTQEAAEEEDAIAEPEKPSADDLIAQGKALVEGSDCKTCHLPEAKLVGPGHAEVAKKYEFTKANVALLSDKIIAGGSGNWGEVPMTAHPDLSKADAEKMAMYVLSLDGEKPKD